MVDPKRTIEKITRQAKNPVNAGFLEQVETNSHLEDIKESLKSQTEPVQKMNDFIEAMRGPKGDTPVKEKDYFTKEEQDDFLKKSTPVKGKHYFTNEEINAFIDHILKHATPVKGKDYYEGRDGIDGQKGRDGKDAEPIDEENIITQLLRKIPKPKDGRHGHDGRDAKIPKTEDIAKEAVNIIRGLKGKEKLSLRLFEEGDEVIGNVRLHANMMKNMPKSLVDGDQRWGGHGGSSTSGSGSTFINNEVVSGSGTTFTLANTPITGTQEIYAYGQRLTPGAGNDYTIIGKIISIINGNNYALGSVLADYELTSGSNTFVNDEIVSGSGTSFILAQTPLVGSEHIYANGQRLTPGAGNDYTISGKNITIINGNNYSTGTILADYQLT